MLRYRIKLVSVFKISGFAIYVSVQDKISISLKDLFGFAIYVAVQDEHLTFNNAIRACLHRVDFS